MAQAIYIGPDGKEAKRSTMKVPKRVESLKHWKRGAIRALKMDDQIPEEGPKPIKLDHEHIIWELGTLGHLMIDRLASSMAT